MQNTDRIGLVVRIQRDLGDNNNFGIPIKKENRIKNLIREKQG